MLKRHNLKKVYTFLFIQTKLRFTKNHYFTLQKIRLPLPKILNYKKWTYLINV